MGHKVAGAVEMVKKSSGGGDHDIDSLLDFDGFLLPGNSSNQHTYSLVVEGAEVVGHIKDLLGKFSGGGDHQDAGASRLSEVHLLQEFDCRNHEGEGFTRAGFGSSEQVSSLEKVRDGLGLDVGHPVELHDLVQGLDGLRTETHLVELFGTEEGSVVVGHFLGVYSLQIIHGHGLAFLGLGDFLLRGRDLLNNFLFLLLLLFVLFALLHDSRLLLVHGLPLELGLALLEQQQLLFV